MSELPVNLPAGRTDKSSNLKLRIAGEKTTRLDRFNDWTSEFCSSILVKETRQALKSRQFVFTYFLLLMVVTGWTVLCIAWNRVDENIAEMGRNLLMGLFMIMGFPLGIIIPFAAYRSLVREFEDGTIQLISITTMRPSQIVIGKFGSAILQMLVYLSVLAPCVLFTYLLRGVSLPQILWGVAIGVSCSICLTILGLFLGGVINSRAMGIGISVLFILLLGWLFVMWCSFVSAVLVGRGFGDIAVQGAQAAIFGLFAFFGSTAALLLVAAASQISFAADNQATRIRVTMLIQQLLFWAFLGMMLQVVPFQNEVFWILAMFIGHYWLIMGFLMIGESPRRSRRVQRTLPQTLVMRSVAGLLMPGPGRGFLFAMAMLWSSGGVLLGMVLFQDQLQLASYRAEMLNNWGAVRPFALAPGTYWKVFNAIGACLLYPSLFLSIGYLCARSRLHRGRFELASGIGPAISLLSGALFVGLLSLGAVVWHLAWTNYGGRSDYSAICLLNWYWTVYEFGSRNGNSWTDVLLVFFLIPSGVLIMPAIVLASRELLQLPLAVPERVIIDQQKPVARLPAGESIDEIFGELK